jgi:hypothetical protein
MAPDTVASQMETMLSRGQTGVTFILGFAPLIQGFGLGRLYTFILVFVIIVLFICLLCLLSLL